MPEERTYFLRAAYFDEVLRQPDHYVQTPAERARYRLIVRNGLIVDCDGTPVGASGAVEAMFVMDSCGGLFTSFFGPDDLRHSSLVAGQPVAAAGLLSVLEGRLVSISNESGHYAPLPSSLQRVMNRLATLGVLGLDLVRIDVVPPADLTAPLEEPAMLSSRTVYSPLGSDAAPAEADALLPKAGLRTETPMIEGLSGATALRNAALKWSPCSFFALLLPVWVLFTCALGLVLHLR